MAASPSIEDLLAAILDAQNRCNNLIGQLFNRLLDSTSQKDQRQDAYALVLDRWKTQNPELAERCKVSMEKFSEVHTQYLERMLKDLSDISDSENEFEVREFIDKYGQGFLQLSGIMHAVGTLGS